MLSLYPLRFRRPSHEPPLQVVLFEGGLVKVLRSLHPLIQWVAFHLNLLAYVLLIMWLLWWIGDCVRLFVAGRRVLRACHLSSFPGWQLLCLILLDPNRTAALLDALQSDCGGPPDTLWRPF